MSNLIEHTQQFIKDLEIKGKSFNTIKNYRTDLKCFTDFMNQKKISSMNEFTDQQVKEFQSYIEKKYPSSNSRRRRVQAVRLFFDFLIRNQLFDHNPIKKLVTSAKVVDIPRPVPFVDVLKLYHHLEEKLDTDHPVERVKGLRNLVIFQLIYGAGLKVSEIEPLKTSHLSLDKRNDLYRVLIVPKKRDPYTLSLPSSYNTLYELYQKELNRLMSKSQFAFDDLLFNANAHKIIRGGLSARGLELLFKSFSKKLEIEVTPRKLRQSCIFKWLTQKVSQATIKERMGVQPAYSLTPYTKLFEEESELRFVEMSELQE